MMDDGQEVKATTTATRKKYKFKVPDEIRTTAAAAKRRNPVLRKVSSGQGQSCGDQLL